MSIEAMKLALEALEGFIPYLPLHDKEQCGRYDAAITALRQAIEQAERSSKRTISYACPVCCASMIEQAEQAQPVAWRTFDGEGGYDYRDYDMNEDYRDEYIKRNGTKYASWVEPLYTTPQQPEQAQPVAWSTRERFYQALNEAVETTKERMFIRTVTMRCKDYDIALPVINIRDGHVVVGQGFTLPQRKPWVELEREDMPEGEDAMFDHPYFIEGMAYAAKKLKEKNT